MGLALATLKPTHSLLGPEVIQDGEFETAKQGWVLCHYFTSERDRFFRPCQRSRNGWVAS